MAVAQLQKLFGRQRHSLCLAASIPGFLFTGTSPWIIKGISEIWPFLSAFLLHKFVPQNCKVCDTDVKVEFSPSSHVCVSLSVSLTGSHPDGNKPRGEAAPTENYESTIPLLLQGKDPRPLSQLRTRVRALITSSVTFHLCFPRTVKQDGRQKRVFRLQMAMEESYFYNINFMFLKWNVRKFFSFLVIFHAQTIGLIGHICHSSGHSLAHFPHTLMQKYTCYFLQNPVFYSFKHHLLHMKLKDAKLLMANCIM